MAYKIAPEQDNEPGEFFTGEAMKEMVELRKIQATREFTQEERERFLKLQTLETEAKKGEKPLSAEEQTEYLALSKMDKYTPEQSARFVELQNRLDKAGREEE